MIKTAKQYATPDQTMINIDGSTDGSTQQEKVVQNAIERVRLAHESSRGEKLYVAFSGGKDSGAVRGIVTHAAEKDKIALADYAEFHYSITGLDPPELVYFIRNTYQDVIQHMPEKSFWQLIERKGPPTRMHRWCCEKLKEHGGDGRMCLTGVRWYESNNRANNRATYENYPSNKKNKILMNDDGEARKFFEQCVLKQKRICNPIVNWSTENVWEYTHDRKLPYCCLYDKGFDRLGCIGCPMAGDHRKVEFERWPQYKYNYIRAFDRMVKRAKELGKEFRLEWESGQDVFDWYMDDRNMDKPIPGQMKFEDYESEVLS